MATILYRRDGDEIVQEKVDPRTVAFKIEHGYAVSPEALETFEEADTNDTGLLSDEEIKTAWQEKTGKKPGRKKIETLKKELLELE